MSTLSTINAINNQTLQFAPAVLAAVQAVEAVAPNMPGADKHTLVVNQVLAGVQAGSASAAGSSNATVAGISGLINLFVSILNATGIFNRKPAVK